MLDRLNSTLQGYPNELLTLLLVSLGLFALVIAFVATPAMKALVAAWFVAP